MRPILFLVALAAAAHAQELSCTTVPQPPLLMRANGLAEPVSDILVTCTGGTPGPSSPVEITVELNTNITSRILNSTTGSSEALLLIDEPQPDSVNMSNGFQYNGQVLGTAGIAAGAAGSGNVYVGQQVSDTSVTWSGIPLVAPGPSATRTLRITNLRANAVSVPIAEPWQAGRVSATLSSSIPIGTSTFQVGFTVYGAAFAASYSASSAAIEFGAYSEGLRPRTDSSPLAPFVLVRQDIPGVNYFSESQFTPCFSYGSCDTTPPDSSIGLASSGAQLLTKVSGLGTSAASLSVPNQLCLFSCFEIDAYLIVNGQHVITIGNTSLPVANGAVDVLYEVTLSAPYSIVATLLDASGASLDFPGTTAFSGSLAPASTVGVASATEPEPRFAEAPITQPSSMICANSSPVEPSVRAEGLAEPLGDILLTCTGGTSGQSTTIDVTVTLNTNLTSRTYGAGPMTSEALILIDDPQPGQINMSNGFQYNGQVLGKPGVVAGAPGSGNVYVGRPASATSATWSGIPFVQPGPDGVRLLRIVNLRANASAVPPGQYSLTPIMASIFANLPIDVPSAPVAFASEGLIFSSSYASPSVVDLNFQEIFATAFLSRVVSTGGPFTESRQDVPGVIYWSESQFTPCFSGENCSSPPGSTIGLASSGTKLEAHLAGLGSKAASLSVPNQISSVAGGQAYLIVNGQPVMSTGSTSLAISDGAATVLYEVTADNPFAIDTFTIPATLLDHTGAPLAFPGEAVFTGHFAPVDDVGTASSTAPEPRFVQ